MKRKCFALFICLALLCGCGANKASDSPSFTASETDAAVEAAAEEDTHETYSEEQLEAFANPKELAVGDSFTVDSQMDASGSIQYTIIAARVIAPGENAGLAIKNFEEYTYVETDPFTKYPDYLTDDGRLAEGCYLVQLDVHAENIDAIGDEEEYGDTTLFRASCLQLDNRKYADDESYNIVTAKSPDYFTGLNEFEQHPMLFRLEQGQSTDYTIGYLVNEKWAVQDADSLFITITGGNGIFEVDLNLGESEGL